jgi:hypothetical protein
MIYRFIFITPIIFFISLLVATAASANWYSYYQQNGYYGIWATIYTPTTKPFTAIGDNQSHSVTTPGGGPWVQTGWELYPNWSQALQYYEYAVGGVQNVVPLNPQGWGTGIKYEVSQEGTPDLKRWCVWINGIQIQCWNGITSAPTILTAQSETHTDPQTVFMTTFQSIRIRNASGTWVSPTLLGNMGAYPPYHYTILNSDSFQTWRYGVFLPIITKGQ